MEKRAVVDEENTRLPARAAGDVDPRKAAEAEQSDLEKAAADFKEDPQ